MWMYEAVEALACTAKGSLAALRVRQGRYRYRRAHAPLRTGRSYEHTAPVICLFGTMIGLVDIHLAYT